jgi:hypothetical protein
MHMKRNYTLVGFLGHPQASAPRGCQSAARQTRLVPGAEHESDVSHRLTGIHSLCGLSYWVYVIFALT